MDKDYTEDNFLAEPQGSFCLNCYQDSPLNKPLGDCRNEYCMIPDAYRRKRLWIAEIGPRQYKKLNDLINCGGCGKEVPRRDIQPWDRCDVCYLSGR